MRQRSGLAPEACQASRGGSAQGHQRISDSARVIVTLQMLLDLTLIVIVARVLLGTAPREPEQQRPGLVDRSRRHRGDSTTLGVSRPTVRRAVDQCASN